MAFIFNPDWKPPGYSAARRVCVVCDRPTIETDVMLYDEEPVDGDGWPLRWWMAHGICMWRSCTRQRISTKGGRDPVPGHEPTGAGDGAAACPRRGANNCESGKRARAGGSARMGLVPDVPDT
jgi:hypothetical protein